MSDPRFFRASFSAFFCSPPVHEAQEYPWQAGVIHHKVCLIGFRRLFEGLGGQGLRQILSMTLREP